MVCLQHRPGYCRSLRARSPQLLRPVKRGALYAQETNAPAAIPWLRRAMQQMSPAQFRSYLNDPDLAPIRESPEYRQFLQELDPVFPGPKPGN